MKKGITILMIMVLLIFMVAPVSVNALEIPTEDHGWGGEDGALAGWLNPTWWSHWLMMYLVMDGLI